MLTQNPSSEEVKFKVGDNVMAIYPADADPADYANYYPAVVTEGPTPTDEGEDYYSVEHVGYEGYPALVWFSQMYRQETETGVAISTIFIWLAFPCGICLLGKSITPF